MAPKGPTTNRRRQTKETASQESSVKTGKQNEDSVGGAGASSSQAPKVRRAAKPRNPGQVKSAERIQTAKGVGRGLKKMSPDVINNLKLLFMDLYVEKYKANGGGQEEVDDEVDQEEGIEEEWEEEGVEEEWEDVEDTE